MPATSPGMKPSERVIKFLLLALLLALAKSVPLLLFANRRNICLVDVGQSQINLTNVVNGLDDAAALDYIFEDGSIFWTDVSLELIRRSWLNGTQTVVDVVTTGLISPDGLACDWIGNKLYWIDSETNRIEVSNMDGSFRKVLIWEDLDQPRAVVLDPLRGYMYWTDWGESPKIERAGMDGSVGSRRVLVHSRIFWPNGLTLDFQEERLYWADGKLSYIHSCNFDGSNRHEVIQNSLPHPFALTLYEDSLFWTDWQTRAIYSCNKSNCVDPKTVISNLFSPMDIHVYSSLRQPKVDNPCGNDNGGCSHLCLLSPFSPFYRCACPTGVRHLGDNKTCAQGPSEILLLARRMDLRWISLDTPDFTDVVLPVTGIRHAIAVDYDPVDDYIYWTDDETRSIRRAYLNGSGVEVVIDGNVMNPDGIAVDWIARNLYWTDSGTDRIEVSRLNGSSHKVLIAENLDEPRAIVLDPINGLMYWTDWGKIAKIEQANLDGTDRKVLVDKNLGWPNGLAIDYKTSKIYWADAKTDRIEFYDLIASRRDVLVNEKLPHIFGITLLGDYIYWTDWQDRAIQRVHKETGKNRTTIVENLPDLMGLKAINISAALGENGCSNNNGLCSHLCLNRPSGFICACPMNYELLADGRTCIVPEAFLIYSRQTDIRRISLETSYNALIPLSGVKSAQALDFDINDNRIYWTDINLKNINRAFMNGSASECIIQFGIERPEGVAVDWVAHNLYWADSVTKRIEMSHMDGSSRKIIVWKDVQPKSLAVDPPQGYLYWSNSMKTSRIERSNLDGNDRIELVSNVGDVNGLTIDYEEKRLYWANADSNIIESAMFDGKDRRQVVNQLPHPYGLTQYQDYIYWTDWKTKSIEKANKSSGLNRTQVQGQLDSVMDISAFHASRQSGWNECGINNGGCSHICVAHSLEGPASSGSDQCVCSNYHKDAPSPYNHTCTCLHHCACPTQYTLKSDNRTCEAPKRFLLYSQRNATIQLLLEDPDQLEVILPIAGMRNARALEYDPVERYVYWINNRTIKRARDDRANSGEIFIPNSISPNDLALDPYTRMLYWSDQGGGCINVTHLNGTAIGMVVKDVQPRSIALLPEKGYLFWTNRGKSPKIERAQLDGTTRMVLFNTGLGSLGSIVADWKSHKIFWVDLDLKRIESGDVDGGNRHTIVDDEIGEVKGLAISDRFLYWVNTDGALMRVDKLTGQNRKTVLTKSQAITDVLIVSLVTNYSDLWNPCSINNGNCTHLCVFTGTGMRRCSCPIGLQLAGDNRSCQEPTTCKPDEFTCANGFCIPLSWHCDGHAECEDKSDERNCSRCPTAQFRCKNGQCIARKQRCSDKGCTDKSDYEDCPPCRVGMKECREDKMCIDEKRWCDGTQDCFDGSDEMSCEPHQTESQLSPPSPMTYTLGIGIVAIVLVLTFVVTLIICCLRKKSRQLTRGGEGNDIVMVQKPSMSSVAVSDGDGSKSPRPSQDAYYSRTSSPSMARSFQNVSNCSESLLYDRSHITGASSSSSMMTRFSDRPLNPPPSPITEHSHSVVPVTYRPVGSRSSKRNSSKSKSRSYKRRRKQPFHPPPTTPCSTDVCEDSESYISCKNGCLRSVVEYGYESDPLCPPPPTPRGHYLSDDQSCPPSPSTERSSFSLALYPPPPPSSVLNFSDA